MRRAKSITLWYPEYPGDYARKTGHLSMAQHGAYLLLRQHYYSTGRPLPTNVPSLYRICGAIEDAEKADVRAVIDEFFTLEPDGYHNGRCDDELAKRRDIREKRQAAVNSRTDRRGTNEPTNVATPTPTPTEGSGSGSSAREPGAEPDSLYRRVCAAFRLNTADILPAKWMPPAALIELDRIRDDLDLTDDEMVSLAEASMARFGRAPDGPRALVHDAKRLAGAKAMPPLAPAIPDPSTGGDHARRLPATSGRHQRSRRRPCRGRFCEAGEEHHPLVPRVPRRLRPEDRAPVDGAARRVPSPAPALLLDRPAPAYKCTVFVSDLWGD